MRVPKGGRERAEPLVDFASAVDGPGRFDSIQLADRVSLAWSTTLNSLARSAKRVLPDDVTAKRLPNVDTKTLRRNPQLLKSVLASFRWKD